MTNLNHTTFTVSGAYGRDYPNITAMRKDWAEGKDFVVRSFGATGTYISKRDADREQLEIWGRFKGDEAVGLLQRSTGVIPE